MKAKKMVTGYLIPSRPAISRLARLQLSTPTAVKC